MPIFKNSIPSSKETFTASHKRRWSEKKKKKDNNNINGSHSNNKLTTDILHNKKKPQKCPLKTQLHMYRLPIVIPVRILRCFSNWHLPTTTTYH